MTSSLDRPRASEGRARTLSEGALWRLMARKIDAGEARLFHLLDVTPDSPPAFKSAEWRLFAYDNPASHYGPEDDYAHMDRDDMVLAALWLALDADAESVGPSESKG